MQGAVQGVRVRHEEAGVFGAAVDARADGEGTVLEVGRDDVR